MSNKRNYKIDVIKTIGILCIILAHVCTNANIIQIRNFDVPLLVFISGFLAYNSYDSSSSYISYIYKRIKRLVFPTWLFLTIYFILLLIIHFVFKIDFPYTIDKIKESYLFLDGIGYVWIVRVYIICALLTPIFIKLTRYLNKNKLIVLVILLFILNEILCYYKIYELNFFSNYFLSYIIGYGAVTLLGLMARNNEKDSYEKFFLVFLIIFLVYCIYFQKTEGIFRYTQTRKYPATLYYFSYALSVTYLLMTFDFTNIKDNLFNKIIIFVSKNSFWIYLWHIFAIYLVGLFNVNRWIIRYMLVLLISFVITFIQNKIKRKG